MASINYTAPPTVARLAQLVAAKGVAGASYAAAAGHPPPDTPLLHFVQLFLEALQQQSEALAQALLQHYRPSLDRDTQLWPLVLRCRALHVPSAAGGGGGSGGSGMGGMLSGLLRQMAQPA